ncbi:MAG TPA: L,D-transpeptidase, partial [Candidatus Dormibacteraeota bacterium]|nr:L,D-transpeptidase [Candidatus Dormibacteraeota bacterium]
ALADAQSAARTALANAQAALARAEAIPALNVQGAAGALPGLAQRVQSAATVADYQSATAALDAQTASLNALVDLRQSAYDLLAKTQAHMQRAQQGGIDVSADQPQLDAAAKALDAASDTSSLDAAKQQVQNVKNDVDVKYNLAVYGPGKVIVVSIALEELEALQDGVVVQDTLVTTGRPSLPTPVGTFSVMAKYSPYHMVSPWPYGNHYYYPPVWLKYAMLWHDGGYFIHDASWRYHYGPGSDTEYGGTHGCINVPGASIGWLYNWAEVGTKVVTLSDVF